MNLFVGIGLLVSLVSALGTTDTITSGGDNSRSGYQANHNMDPAVIGSSSFGQLWSTQLLGNYGGVKEQIFAQPLVYSPSSGTQQFVYVATTQNTIYKIDAKTGNIVQSRVLAIPFLQADLDGCTDLNPHIGSTATGVIDPVSDTWYFTIKTYADQSQINIAQGRLQGRYYVYAVSTNDLSNAPNFPLALEGLTARNNARRGFISGNQHQRPALLQSNGFFYAGFASHCVQYNFTGFLMGWDASGKIVERYTTEAGLEDITIKGGGIWMSGGGITSDDAGSMWFGTGNGYASQLHGTPVPGRQPPTALEEAAVHAKINEDGTISVFDFFMPMEKEALDGADKDLGTTPLELLPSTFTCPNNKRMGVITGKSGKTYFLDMDNLGGYCMGPNKGDAAIGVYQNENSVYAGAGVYPLEGGYIYINVIQYPIRVFKFSCDTNGYGLFTPVAVSNEKNSYVLGTGHGTTTSLNGKAGTGLLWVPDVQGFGLRIYNAVPVNGQLNLLRSFNIQGVTKFQRPVFGNGIVYIGTNIGNLVAIGSPVNSPLVCTNVDFGDQVLGSTSKAQTVSCLAQIDTVVTGVALTSVAQFALQGVTTPYTVAKGANITFLATFTPNAPGPQSNDLYLNTTNSVTGYSTQVPCSLSGVGDSLNALLAVSPNTVSFNGVITGQNPVGTNGSFMIINSGDQPLNITSYAFSTIAEGGITTTPTTISGGIKVGAFTFFNLPNTIAAKSGVTVIINFGANASAAYAVYLTINTNGGSKIVDVFGTSSDEPKALIEFQTIDGTGWVPFDSTKPFTFGTVTEGSTRYLNLRLTNAGGPNAGFLSVTVSKPPVGSSTIVGANNGVDLGEGTDLGPGESANATLYCSVPRSQVNIASYNATVPWTINTGDPTMGKQIMQFYCNAVAEQLGPLTSNGDALYRYIGCAKENNPGRQLATQAYGNQQNENNQCQNACFAKGYTFAGTQYQVECWCGNAIPVEIDPDYNCNYNCAGAINQTCGGNGLIHDGSYISLFARSDKYTKGSTPLGPGAGTTTITTSMAPIATATIGPYSFLGCYTEATNGKALKSLTYYNDSMTLELCASACNAYPAFGVEYGRECYCGNTIDPTSTLTTIGDCSFPCPGNTQENCGAGNRLQMYSIVASVKTTTTTSSSNAFTSKSSTTTAPPVTTISSTTTGSLTTSGPTSTATIGGYSFVGCYSEASNGRALGQAASYNDTMTLDWCIASCTGFQYAGVEYGRECYCGNTLGAGSTLQPPNDCSFVCVGNSAQNCGAGSRLQLYQKIGSTFTTSSSSSISVSSTSTSSTQNTSSPSTGATSSITSSSSSSTTISGPTSTATIGAYSFIGCYSEGTNSRALTQAAFYNDKMTLDWCLSSCNGFMYAGVEYGRECYCGDILSGGSSSQPLADCSFVCAGNGAQNCGAGSRLQMYELTSATQGGNGVKSSITTMSSTSSISMFSSLSSMSSLSSSTSSKLPTTTTSLTSTSSAATKSPTTASTSGSSKTSSTTSSAASTASTLSAGWTYIGCANETNPRALSQAAIAGNMTNQACQSFCLSQNLPLAGTEYANECYCGTALQSNSTVGYTGCNMPCSGDPSQTCGGSSRLSVYSYQGFVPTSQAASVGNYKLSGCFTEGMGGRALPGYSFTNTTMTAELCVSTCQVKGYSIAGAEYAKECYCGNALSNGSTKLADSQCNMPCAGNSREYCGAGSRLTVYALTK